MSRRRCYNDSFSSIYESSESSFCESVASAIESCDDSFSGCASSATDAQFSYCSSSSIDSYRSTNGGYSDESSTSDASSPGYSSGQEDHSEGESSSEHISYCSSPSIDSYRSNGGYSDESSKSDASSLGYSTGQEDHSEGESSSESDEEACNGSAKRYYLDEKRSGSILKESKKEHIQLLRAMAIGLDDNARQDDRFDLCVENGFMKKKDVDILKRHLHAEASRRSSGKKLKAVSSWKVEELKDHLQKEQNKVKEVDRLWIEKTIDSVLGKAEKSPPIWYVSANNKAVGYTVLYNLMMQCEESHIFQKSIQSVWESSSLFHCYPFATFQEYFKSMKKLANADRCRWREEEEAFKKECKAFPQVRDVDRRGNKYWYDSQAKKLLYEDVKNGRHIGKKPSELRDERDEYKMFTKKKFRVHLYAEIQQQRCDKYWKVKRNKVGLEKHHQDAADVTNDLLDEEMLAARISEWTLND